MDCYALNMAIMETRNMNDKYTKKELVEHISHLKKVDIMSMIRKSGLKKKLKLNY